tara:strand:- start:68 stop:250 length:183 start_codon:yes stop_codon:yes gene_type:complete
MGEERMSEDEETRSKVVMPPVTEEDLYLLCDIVGSLAIDQFNNQEEYRAVINEIFYEWSK